MKFSSVKAVQLLNAEYPIEVTDSGMVREVREPHPENADSPMEVTDSGIMHPPALPIGHSIKVVLLLLKSMPFSEQYLVLSSLTSIEMSEAQLLNA